MAAKWRQRAPVGDPRTGLKDPRSTVLSPADEADVVAFPRHTRPSLDDDLFARQATILHRTRSSLHLTPSSHRDGALPTGRYRFALGRNWLEGYAILACRTFDRNGEDVSDTALGQDHGGLARLGLDLPA
jgi:hypothetical protein